MINTPGHVIPCLIHLLATAPGNAPGNPLSSSSPPRPTHTHAHTHLLSSLSFAPSLFAHPHSSCKEHSTMFLLAELCRLSLRAWKTSVLPLVPAANAHISHIFCLLSVNSSLQPPHIIQAPRQMQDRVGQIRPLTYITSTSSLSLFLCLQSLSIIHSHSIQIPLSGGYLPFSLCLSEPAECRCVSLCVTVAWWGKASNMKVSELIGRKPGVWQALSHRQVSVWGHTDVTTSENWLSDWSCCTGARYNTCQMQEVAYPL